MKTFGKRVKNIFFMKMKSYSTKFYDFRGNMIKYFPFDILLFDRDAYDIVMGIDIFRSPILWF